MAVQNDALLIGSHGMLAIEGLQVGVEILDVKRAYGRVRYVVIPLQGGALTATVDSNRVVIQDN